jgi:hypothetical protein
MSLMINKELNKITIDDFQGLIDNEVMESRTIEYKELLSLKTDGDRKEFLADISSFANAGGGDLIFGIEENETTRVPEKLIGIDIEKMDQLQLKIDSLIRDGIAPRINGLLYHKVETPEKKFILLIRIPHSWNAPHRVNLLGSNKFYTRSSNGKYQLDVDELRAAFLLSDTVTNKIRGFIAERVGIIASEETPVPLLPYGKIAIHLVPISSFTPGKAYDIYGETTVIRNIRPLNGGSRTPRYNLDGLISSSMNRSEPKSESYAQFFRNGIIETVNAEILTPIQVTLWIPASGSLNYESLIVEIIREYLDLYRKLNIDLPVFLFLSLINVKGYKLSSHSPRNSDDQPTFIKKDIFTLPEVAINTIDDDIPALMKPIFDVIWNACGLGRSHNYDDNGAWKPR